MIQYTKNLLLKLKEATLKKKIIIGLFVFLYIAIILMCTISFKYNYTSPGTLNRINEVIEIENAEVKNHFYTVSVYTQTKRCSILEYLFRKMDKKQEIITEEEYNSNFTTNEETKAGEAQKSQSIQDAIICAYDIAKEDGYDVSLDKTYLGVCVCYMPANYFGTGPESIQIKDIITKVGETEIKSYLDLCTICYSYYENGKYKEEGITCPTIEIIRSGEKLTLDHCNIKCLAQLGAYYSYSLSYQEKHNLNSVYEYLVNYMYDCYNLDTEHANPTFSINEASSIGPSGGLCQTLYVYNAITNNSLTTEDALITATGTIINDGSVGVIGAVDKKVYTIDIYISKYFFVPQDNYEEAMTTYNTIKNPDFTIISVTNARDAISFLRNGGSNNG